jgi:hypothetical protein
MNNDTHYLEIAQSIVDTAEQEKTGDSPRTSESALRRRSSASGRSGINKSFRRPSRI